MKEYFEEELIQKAVNQYIKEENEQIEEELKNVDEKFVQMIQDNKKIDKVINKEFRKKNRTPKFLSLYKIASVAAMILLAFDIFVLMVPAVRNATAKFINYVNDEYTDIGKSTKEIDTRVDDNNSINEIKPVKEYQITYIPEGMKLVDYSVADERIIYNYFGGKNQFVSFYQESKSISVAVDTKDATVTVVSINGIDATLVKREKQMTLFYETSGYVFRLESMGVEDKILIKMAESIREK